MSNTFFVQVSQRRTAGLDHYIAAHSDKSASYIRYCLSVHARQILTAALSDCVVSVKCRAKAPLVGTTQYHAFRTAVDMKFSVLELAGCFCASLSLPSTAMITPFFFQRKVPLVAAFILTRMLPGSTNQQCQ